MNNWYNYVINSPEYNHLNYTEGRTNIQEYEKLKEGNQMSFVGIALCEDGIIAFGDSKGSITDVFGNLKHDKKRGQIQKVFKNKDYVLVTCNANSYYNQKNKYIYLEDFLSLNIKFDYLKLLNNLIDECSSNSINFNNLYKFMIGSKDELGFFIQYIDVMNNQIILNKKIRKIDIYTMGNFFYTSLTKQLYFSNPEIKSGEVELPTLLEEMIKKADNKYGYNPVGLPIQIEIFQ